MEIKDKILNLLNELHKNKFTWPKNSKYYGIKYLGSSQRGQLLEQLFKYHLDETGQTGSSKHYDCDGILKNGEKWEGKLLTLGKDHGYFCQQLRNNQKHDLYIFGFISPNKIEGLYKISKLSFEQYYESLLKGKIISGGKNSNQYPSYSNGWIVPNSINLPKEFEKIEITEKMDNLFLEFLNKKSETKKQQMITSGWMDSPLKNFKFFENGTKGKFGHKIIELYCNEHSLIHTRPTEKFFNPKTNKTRITTDYDMEIKEKGKNCNTEIKLGSRKLKLKDTEIVFSAPSLFHNWKKIKFVVVLPNGIEIREITKTNFKKFLKTHDNSSYIIKETEFKNVDVLDVPNFEFKIPDFNNWPKCFTLLEKITF